MSNNNGLSKDQTLLARLNALKQSTIDLDAKKHVFEPNASASLPVDPAPARDLHKDLVSRFKTLNGQGESYTVPSGAGQDEDQFQLFVDEDGKTVDEMLAELGPEDTWNIQRDEEAQITDLIKAAQSELNTSKARSQLLAEGGQGDKDEPTPGEKGNERSNFKQPVTKSPPKQPMEPTEEELDEEADEYIAKLLEEIGRVPEVKHEQDTNIDDVSNTHDSIANSQSPAKLGLPSASPREPDPPTYSEVTADDNLASRLASLNLPSVPTTTMSEPAKPTQKQQSKGYTDDEIESWCVICNDDASLVCAGCDGDLYCTKCWLEGHKGPDAGHEERTHRAKEYVRGGQAKHQAARRLVGA
ncbi:hypothetical protein LTS08_004949 [Lithohypha guttulata]|uniref:Uncharacterized protein n=1 Tax=Lithohypha guttulata TaxID=1690604 RepID=A0AAN7YIN6_9EURO|nr:hypothetical protein LTR05_002205 [Lithohypha guttulata]KAK5101342.1 hypothetical protein LTS08_004949 [Lithohypha guttulata]